MASKSCSLSSISFPTEVSAKFILFRFLKYAGRNSRITVIKFCQILRPRWMTESNQFRGICFLCAVAWILFSFYHQEVKSSVWHSCAEARHFSLNRWYCKNVVWEEQGLSSSFDLLNFLTLFFACVTPFGFSTGQATCAALAEVHIVKTVCKSRACKARSGCQNHPICNSAIVEHIRAAVILLL